MKESLNSDGQQYSTNIYKRTTTCCLYVCKFS